MAIERLSGAAVQRLGGPAGAAGRLRALVPDGASVEGAVREIIDRVRAEGDQAVRHYTRLLDTGGVEPRALVVGAEELDEAIKKLPLDVVAGLQVAIANVANVAQAGASEDVAVDLPQGHRVALREVPVGSAAIYVPGGRAPYPSTVVMGVVTARAAGVLDVAVCAPPGADGQIDAAILGTARLCGVERVYRMGGAQAIAALALGTDTVDPVDVVVGPGNLYVQEAKRLLSGAVGIDGFAGPSDLLILLGNDAGKQELRLAALDMIAQGEHGEGSLVVAVTTTESAADALATMLEGRLAEPPLLDGAVFAIVEVAEAKAGVALANAFAPEHLQLIGADVEALAVSVTAAGCLFVGRASATAFGDYVAGSNHILPTGGSARFASMLSARHFRRRMAEVRVDDQAAVRLAKAGAPIALIEGFDWHARSMEARMGDNRED
jgi:histidinol dehydrogenase